MPHGAEILRNNTSQSMLTEIWGQINNGLNCVANFVVKREKWSNYYIGADDLNGVPD